MTTTDFATDRVKGLLFGLASVIVGLALGIWYVGVRIVSADEIVPATALYLQVADLGPKADQDSVRSLENEGFRPQVMARGILIGPFSTHAELEKAQSKLQSAGVLAVETAH